MRYSPVRRRLQASAIAVIVATLILTVVLAFQTGVKRRELPSAIRMRIAEFVPYRNWTTKWWLDPDFGRIPLPVATKKCPLCFFRPLPGNGTSTLADVVLTVAIAEIHGLPTMVRSVRTAGIEAAIIVLADSIATNVIRQSIPQIITHCGVLVVNVGLIGPKELSSPWKFYINLLFDFLQLNPYDFKRFIAVDSADTFFQGDPFGINISERRLYFPSIIPTNPPKRGKGQATPDQIAVSPLLGGVAPFLTFSRLLFPHAPWPRARNVELANLSINLAIRSKKLTNATISCDLLPPGKQIALVSLIDKRFGPAYDANGYIALPRFPIAAPVIAEYLALPRTVMAQIRALCASDEIQWAFKNQ
jgi:hypothetical protein